MSGITIFMYHQIGPFPKMAEHRASYCNIDRFRAQMRMLKLLGIPVLSMSTAARALRGEIAMPRRAVVLSFDDGCRNFHEHALPVLRAHGFPAIVYAISDMIGGTADWLASAGHPAAPLMNWEELRSLPADNIEIGSHSANHIRLGDQDATRQIRELRDSKARLEDGLGRAVPHVCYPYGSHGPETLKAAAQAGYETGVTCQRGAATPAFDPLALPRKAISQGDDSFGFLWKLYAKDAPKGTTLFRPDWHQPHA
ncbi:polysaccharide deacetylase [Thioclava dalianensis]|uniref:Chitooligosaccharide deacetylase n=1 Tax=Thioclava dalianensis TaxID=1185766 RepID=A0A074TGY3_9RHOB|nr:polysaccharide deacetylase family protein [Thioclava dalianensis]KEP70929.1 polysaccharide deacetylase [Thioclava dalianensis]SFN13896.1 Polysaccharide deacetylase [Thioclava dalianensis]